MFTLDDQSLAIYEIHANIFLFLNLALYFSNKFTECNTGAQLSKKL